MRQRRKQPEINPADWIHRPGSPGYYVTKDGQFQLLLNRRRLFVICKKEGSDGYAEVVRGPARDPVKLGIPTALVAEADRLMLDDILERAKRGESVDVSLVGGLA